MAACILLMSVSLVDVLRSLAARVKSFNAEDTEEAQGKPAGSYAYYCGPTRKEDAGRSAEPLDALRRRALLRGEVSK